MEYFSYAWGKVKQDLLGWTIINLVFTLVVTFSSGFGVILTPNYYRAIQKSLGINKSPNVVELFELDNISDDAITVLVFICVNSLGVLLCGLGQFVTAPFTYWMLSLCAEKQFKPVDCCKASIAHAQGKIVDIWKFIIIMSIMTFVITIFTCGLGALIASPMWLIAVTRCYEEERESILEAAKDQGLHSLQSSLSLDK